ncbi:hypothetical protein OE88DRAFT_226493 [Heliocybe sulcata]|uniref:Uncharacterized protein n=1 Tax=Heliocybe sulcata TaxID=5364 RepID=A0A5C3N266_9AGAM|nr:hypothetical protein OE88DRAFT_226493 [Heliocybe sulcata]
MNKRGTDVQSAKDHLTMDRKIHANETIHINVMSRWQRVPESCFFQETATALRWPSCILRSEVS